jgi:hypothetical protein
MTQDIRGGAPSKGRPGAGGPGGDRRDGPGGNRGGPRKGGSGKGGFGKGGPTKTVRAETYESLKQITRGEGFHIDKFQLAEKGTHKPIKTEYRLTREGLTGIHSFERLADAQIAATAPLPEPAPPEPETAEAETAEPSPEGETPATGEETPA